MNTTFKTTLFLSLTLISLQTIAMRTHINVTAVMTAAIFMVVDLYLLYRISNWITVTTCDARESKAAHPFRS